MIKQLFGERIAVVEAQFEVAGELLMPDGYNSLGRDYRLGKVVGVPDLKYMEKGTWKEAPMHYVELGDLVIFQIPAKITESVQYCLPKVLDGQTFSIILQGDILGILRGRTVSPETFEIAGNWVLLETFFNKPETSLELPANFTPALKDFRVRVAQVGKGVQDARYKPGDEVFVEKSRCNPIYLNTDKEYAFCEKMWIFGVNQTDDQEAKVEPSVLVTL